MQGFQCRLAIRRLVFCYLTYHVELVKAMVLCAHHNALGMCCVDLPFCSARVPGSKKLFSIFENFIDCQFTHSFACSALL